jgi:hypothetical protein
MKRLFNFLHQLEMHPEGFVLGYPMAIKRDVNKVDLCRIAKYLVTRIHLPSPKGSRWQHAVSIVLSDITTFLLLIVYDLKLTRNWAGSDWKFDCRVHHISAPLFCYQFRQVAQLANSIRGSNLSNNPTSSYQLSNLQ